MQFSLTASIPRFILAHARSRLSKIFPLGIRARLTLSLAAVAVLAATANMLARESVYIIHVGAASRTVAASPISVPAQPQTQPAPPDKKHAETLIRAVDRYEHASQARVEADSLGSDVKYGLAREKLQRAAFEYKEAMSAATPPAPAVGRRAAEYLSRGQELIQLADQRRVARVEHAARSAAILTRLQGSLNGAFRIFGHVFARQSLMQLRADFDAVRQHSESVLAGDKYAAEESESLLASEIAFAADFEAQRRTFARTDGEAWVQGVNTDFDALVAQRAVLEELNSQIEDAARQFTEAHILASTAIAAASETPPRALAAPRALAVSPQFSELIEPASHSVAESTLTGPDRSTRSVMAAVTVIMILFITAISVLTVLSVLNPVRRIVKATMQLSRGEMQAQVPRGGIRELDKLAGAFNEMAARLAAAQELGRSHQENLEQTVLERTQKLQQLSQQDPLTSLPNRRHLSTLLNAAIDHASRAGNYVGVYFLDIDNFKNFNDSLGHAFGDRVLMSVANRLEEVADDVGIVARQGGDEFTFVYEGATSIQAVQEMGWKLVHAFQTLISVDGRELSISVSVGASIFPDHGRDADGLLRAADSALFRAKDLGRSQLAVFTPELIESAAARFSIEQGLRRALEKSEFELAYQPEIDLSTMELAMVEALLRWRMPDGRLARPGEFLAVAEQSGLISEISVWVMRTAVMDAARWFHGGWPEARVAINVSPRQLLDQRFIGQTLALLREFNVPAKCIELELTESMLQTGSSTIDALAELQTHGFGIALDDFGTGYSSLTSLEHLPLSRIKLDRSLIASIDTSARSAAIARAIIGLCAGLGLQVTAEGVERPQQFAWLMASGGIFLQGYLFSDAVPFADVLRLKASLVRKIQELRLSLPSIPRHPPLELIKGKSAVRA